MQLLPLYQYKNFSKSVSWLGQEKLQICNKQKPIINKLKISLTKAVALHAVSALKNFSKKGSCTCSGRLKLNISIVISVALRSVDKLRR